MEIRQCSSGNDERAYDAWIRSQPQASLWQSLEWKRYQKALGRETRIYALMEDGQILASALVIIDRTVFGYSTWDIPRGPLFGQLAVSGERPAETLLNGIIGDAMKEQCLTLFLSPSIPLKTQDAGHKTSLRSEQPSATRLIDLTQSEDEILAQMKPKGRYNIAVAEKHGVRVEESQDIDAFYALLKETGGRDQFGIKPLKHYELFLKEISGSFLLLAKHTQDSRLKTQDSRLKTQDSRLKTQDSPIAGLLGVIWGKTGIYYYGASKYDARALMAPYALQWAAMRHCKASGCTSYDLLGIAPPDSPESHPWHGVSAFKEKFGGQVIAYPPEQQIILRPVAYRLLQWKRKILG